MTHTSGLKSQLFFKDRMSYLVCISTSPELLKRVNIEREILEGLRIKYPAVTFFAGHEYGYTKENLKHPHIKEFYEFLDNSEKPLTILIIQTAANQKIAECITNYLKVKDHKAIKTIQNEYIPLDLSQENSELVSDLFDIISSVTSDNFEDIVEF